MKKEMFNLWYNEFGKELAKTTFPIDDVEEHEIRKRAKNIFSYTYNMISDFLCDRFELLHEQIKHNLNFLNDEYLKWSNNKQLAENMRDEATPYLTKLYDSYYKEKSIGKEEFNMMKSHFAEIVEVAKERINNCDAILSEIKQERKHLESLLVTE